jgi:16S rRNA (cytidine1402-2'-O)-methyltransferase
MSDPPERQFVIAGQAIPAGPLAAGLHVVATPIGNLADVTLRALSTLAAADRVYCEDTRITRRLLERYGIRAALKAYHEHNAERMRPVIMDELKSGAKLALVSDAGTPLVSDPGFKLVRAAIEEGLAVHAVPGPSAAVMALALSGLPSDRFMFAGFLPPRSQARRSALEELKACGATLILYEAGPRVAATLDDISQVMGDPPVALARELTKLHEEVLRGRASEVAETVAARDRLKGEITLVVGAAAAAAQTQEDVDRALAEALEKMTPAKAAAAVARRFNLPRGEIYRRAMALKGSSDAAS